MFLGSDDFLYLIGSAPKTVRSRTSWISAIVDKPDGTLWIGGAKALFTYRAGVLSEYAHGLGNIAAMARDSAGNLWVGAGTGLYFMKKGNQNLQRVSPHTITSDVNAVLGSESSADPKQALDRAVQVFLVEAAPGTVDTLQKQIDNPQVLQAKLDDPVRQVDLGVVTGLVLGAPEFQRR